MNRLIGCETAREQLDAFMDGELSVDEQVMVESHLRWCRTCACRVDDLRLIGAVLREGSPAHVAADADAQAIAAIPAGVLIRIRAEHEQSFGVRLKEMFSDMRLLWPALGATTALAICISGAFLLLQWSTQQRPESLAAMISTLAQPGSVQNPLRPNHGVPSLELGLQQYVEENRPSAGISIPRAADDGGMFEDIARALDDGAIFNGIGDDAVYALSTIVTRDGRIANYQVLSEASGRGGQRTSRQTVALDAVLADAVMQSRFAPAQTPGGSKVAVNMVWLIISTTAVKPAAPPRVVQVRDVVEVREPDPVRAPDPLLIPAAAPEAGGEQRSALPLAATA